MFFFSHSWVRHNLAGIKVYKRSSSSLADVLRPLAIHLIVVRYYHVLVSDTAYRNSSFILLTHCVK